VPDEPAEQQEEELEPKPCPRGHGAMRLRTRWADARPGQKGSRAQQVTEWFCPRCGRTAPVD